MKKTIIAMILIILSFIVIINVNAEVERKYAKLPEIVNGTFTNFSWGASMEVGISAEYSQDGNNSFMLSKTSIQNETNNGASIYYQNFGNKIIELGISDYLGVQLTVYNTKSISGGLAFKFDGREVYSVESYDEEGTDLSTRDLNYEGYRTYVVPFDSINCETVREFEISVWGTEIATIYVSDFQIVYTGENETPEGSGTPGVPETPENPVTPEVPEERKYEALPEISNGTFTNFAWGASMEVGISAEYSQDGKNSFKLDKTAVNDAENNGASIYYQGFGSKVAALGVSDYVAVKLTVYNTKSISGGLAFMFGGTEVYAVEAYDEEGTNLATRDLNYVGYRTYVVPFENIDIENVNEFQINLWGSEIDTIYVSQFEIVYTGEKQEEIIKYDNYILSLNGEEQNIDSASDDYFASFTIELKVGDVVRIFGDSTELTSSDGFIATKNGLHTFNVNSRNIVIFEEPEELILPEYSYKINDFEDEEDIKAFGISGTSGTDYSLSLNTNSSYILVGDGSASYAWNSNISGFAYTEIYINVANLIEANANSDLQGISFDIYNTSAQTVGEVGFWLKVTELDGSEYEASYEYIVGGTGLGKVGWRKVYIPFSAITLFQNYTTDENGQFDITQLSLLKIGMWSSGNAPVSAELYLDNLCLLSNTEINESSSETPEQKPGFEKAPQYSYLLSGFESSDLANWGISGTSGTIYNITPAYETIYVKEGTSSLNYRWSNELYSFGYTEIYMDVTSYIEMFSSNDLKGVSFWIYVTEEQTLGEVGFWLKAAEADGSEYEAFYGLIEGGTGLDTVGWRQVYIPFSSFTVEQTYATDENGQLDIEQLAYLKFGLWSNKRDIVNVELYIDDFRLMSSDELQEPVISEPGDVNPTPQDPEKNNDGVIIAIIVSSAVAICLFAGVAAFVIIKKKRK